MQATVVGKQDSEFHGKSPLLVVGPNLSKLGGATTHLRRLLECCSGGQDLHLATFGRANVGLLDLPDTASQYFLGHRGWIDYPQTVYSLTRLIKEIQPAAILAFGIQPLIAVRAAGVAARFKGRVGFFEITRPWAAHAFSRRGLRGVVQWRLAQWAARGADIVAVNSLSGWAELEAVCNVPAYKLRLLRNIGPDITAAPPRARPESGQALRVLVLARLVVSKGVEGILQAASVACRKIPLTVVICGTGPEAKDLQVLAKSLTLSDVVFFVGDAQDVLAELNKADVLVCSSSYEGFPNAVLEAMSMGVPVLTTLWGVDAVSLAERGVVQAYRANDIDALADAFIALGHDPTLRQALSHRGTLEVELTFDRTRLARQYREFVDELTTDGTAKYREHPSERLSRLRSS